MSLLKVTGLGKSFGGVKAVDGIHFELAAGELLALIGPNGAGKSTTFNMVNGQLPADVGSIQLNGQVCRLFFKDTGALKLEELSQSDCNDNNR